MVRIARYGRILEALKQDKYQIKTGIVLEFEDYQLVLSDRHHLLAVFCLLSMRPANKQLSQILWHQIRVCEFKNIYVPPYIFNYAETIYFDLLYSNTNEERTKALSVANSKTYNPAYKGKIIAVNITTKETVILRGSNELRAYGFSPNAVYNCVNEKKSSYTHKGYVFVRVGIDNEKASKVGY